MTPEQLVEKMAERMVPRGHALFKAHCNGAESLLRIVLQAIEDGEVVNTYHLYDPTCCQHSTERKLKPDFANFLAERE